MTVHARVHIARVYVCMVRARVCTCTCVRVGARARTARVPVPYTRAARTVHVQCARAHAGTRRGHGLLDQGCNFNKKCFFGQGAFLWYREHETFARVKQPVVFAFSCDHGMGAKYTALLIKKNGGLSGKGPGSFSSKPVEPGHATARSVASVLGTNATLAPTGTALRLTLGQGA